MYDELILRLRDAAKMSDALAVLLPHSEGNATAKLYKEAADAIEELSRCLDKVHDAHNEGYDVGYWAGRRDYEPKWIPVTERLPEEDGEYLTYVSLDDNEPFCGIISFDSFDSNVPAFGDWEEFYDPVTYGRVGSDFIEAPGITHWMPLPEPPKEEAV